MYTYFTSCTPYEKFKRRNSQLFKEQNLQHIEKRYKLYSLMPDAGLFLSEMNRS
jgi:hypothetical protein